MRLVVFWFTLSSACLSFAFESALTQETPEKAIDVALAIQCFHEASDRCGQDAGKLWGVPIYGPMLLVEPESRGVVANQADNEGKLRPQGGVFAGTLPEQVNIANTATNWAGVDWTMIMWPLPEERRTRLRLMTHELFHRIQNKIGLASTEVSNRHLDSQDGRIWLRLEWRALERALEEQGTARREAIADAVYFRRYRQSLFSGSAAEECALESNEGIAEYTGLKLSSRSDGEFVTRAACALQQSGNAQSFVRSFAYSSGPAYGALLDVERIQWRSGFKAGGDLNAVLARGLKLKPAAASERDALARAQRYDGDEVIASETRRETIRRERSSKYRAHLIDGPVLVIPIGGSFNYSYNPNNLVPISDTGMVYPTMRVTDDWGILVVTDGALLIRTGSTVTRLQVAAPADLQARPLQGPGWKLELQAGWEIVPGDRKGDFILRKQS